MIVLRDRRSNQTARGEAVTAAKLPGRRVALSRVTLDDRLFRGSSPTVREGVKSEVPLTQAVLTGAPSLTVGLLPRQRRPVLLFGAKNDQRGFSLIELVITVTVLTILTMGVVPLLKLSVKRQKEQQLRDALRQMRLAIDDFHRDTVGMQCTGTTAIAGGGTGGTGGPPNNYVDPRSKVVISDCTIFGVDNPDRYPPDLDTLKNGVNVIPRGGVAGGQGLQSTGTAMSNTNSVLGGSELSTRKKVYLRGIPIDPMTGEADWEFRSCYDEADSGSWGGENVFDVRSKSKDKALNGEKYSDW